MSLKAYLWGLRISTLLALGAWGTAVLYVDPEKSGYAGQLIFFVSLFLFLSGTFALFLTALRKRKVEGEEQFFQVGMSFRQGILLALLAIGLLIMQHFRILVWWDGLLVLVGILLIELYFLSR